MNKKTSKHFRAATINADRHNRREKQLEHTRPELQPENKADWIWEADDKESIYQMRKRAEKEYYEKERTVKGKNGSSYTAHRSLPKNAEPIKEAVVVIKEDTTIEDVKAWAVSCQEKYGIRPVGVYLHLDEGHWGELNEEAGQTEDMYRRDDGKEWKRQNERGNREYWKPNYHAHVVFDWFDHDNACCYNLGRKIMSDMEDDLALKLGMERGTPSGKKGLDAYTWKALKESERINRELVTATKKFKSLQTMINNLQEQKNKLGEELENVEQNLINGYGEKIRKDKVLQEIDEKIADKQTKLDATVNEINAKLEELAEIQSNLQEVESKWLGKYRKLAEMKDTIKQLNDTIAKLRPIADQVPSLQEQLSKAEEKLSAMPKELANARNQGQQEGMREAVTEICREAGIAVDSTPTPTAIGKEYSEYKQKATGELPKVQEENKKLKEEANEEKKRKKKEEKENTQAKDELAKRTKIMEYMWPGAWDAVKIIIDPDNDKLTLKGIDKNKIVQVTGKYPKERIDRAHDLIGAAACIRDVADSTIKEIYEAVTASGREELNKYIVADDIETQTIATCLFFGLIDAATQYSESAGGGGGSPSDNDWGRKKDEDEYAFANRCVLRARNMLEAGRGETITESRRRGRSDNSRKRVKSRELQPIIRLHTK